MEELKGPPLTHLSCTGFKTQGQARNNDTDDKKKKKEKTIVSRAVLNALAPRRFYVNS